MPDNNQNCASSCSQSGAIQHIDRTLDAVQIEVHDVSHRLGTVETIVRDQGITLYGKDNAPGLKDRVQKLENWIGLEGRVLWLAIGAIVSAVVTITVFHLRG